MEDENGQPEAPSALWSDSEVPVPLLGVGEAADVSEGAGRNGDETRTGRALPVDLVAASAADFSPERMLRAAGEEPASGWRRAVFSMTGGLVHIGPSAAELRYRELSRRSRRLSGAAARSPSSHARAASARPRPASLRATRSRPTGATG